MYVFYVKKALCAMQKFSIQFLIMLKQKHHDQKLWASSWSIKENEMIYLLYDDLQIIIQKFPWPHAKHQTTTKEW